MKLLVGLGNLGEKFKNNRHNVGFMVVDKLRSTICCDAEWVENKKLKAVVYRTETADLVLAKPQTFMNNSGEAVSKLINWFKVNPEDLYVIHDDLDIKLGEYKIQKGKGPKLHYGLQSIEDTLGTGDFWRVRVGVDNRASDDRIAGERYVLEDLTEYEKGVVDRVVSEIVENYSHERF
ncbi:MAG: aminoacyl-tRNA hydrolase [Candidatus Blackburnbacteria bacterium]|nr:aminoacyl-tRNA hydrolase [Candidatus Blackburnbacteria bacterium]